MRAGKGNVEVLSWAIERPDGGRGYGFTGGHYHHNWAQRRLPQADAQRDSLGGQGRSAADGVESTVTPEDLKANLDKK